MNKKIETLIAAFKATQTLDEYDAVIEQAEQTLTKEEYKIFYYETHGDDTPEPDDIGLMDYDAQDEFWSQFKD